MSCLDDRAVQKWIGGALPETQRDEVRTHLDSCDSCRDLVASAIDGQWIGQTAGRYKLVELIGAGAMGEVYRAEDPDLGRDIAIKILHAGGSQLLREAQAMAKLAHVNVMRIYDVGTVDDRVFLAMELVTGTTLRARFGGAWKPLVELVRSAGNGLAAAHAAGLVHGDFKPDNVLVNNDGRVLVTDFGLARGHEEATPQSFAGTPAYMAPEQFAGTPATAASDQFSFCVTLFEAIYGERPFKGSDETALKAAHATLTFPAKSIPRALVKLLRRGLAVDPAARFSSMTELLEHLESSPGKVIGSTVALLGAGVIAALVVTRSSGGPACAESADQLAGVWDDATRAKVALVFEASGLAYAKTSLATVEKQLDGYAAAWTATHGETCAATHVRGTQSEALLDLRMHCLERRRHELGALVEQLTGGDKDILRDAVSAANALPSVDDCADVTSLRELQPLPTEPVLRKRVLELEAENVRCRSLAAAGRHRDATPCAQAVAALGAELKYGPVIAEAELTVGESALRLRRWDDSQAAFTRALLAAETGRDSRTRAEVLIGLVSVAGERATFPQGHERADLATALIKGLDDKELAAQLALATGVFALREGKFEVAIEALERCVAIREQLYGKDDGRIADPLVPLAIAYTSRGKPDLAVPFLERAIKLDAANRGDTHPAVGKTLHALAQIQVRMGKTDDALASQKRSLAILRATYGDEHADVAQSIGAEAQIMLIAGRYAEAIAPARRAAELMEKISGPDHPDTAIALSTLSATLSRTDDTAGALAVNQRALAIRMKALGPSHLHTTQSQVSVAMGLRIEKRCDEALVLYEAARTTRLAQLPADHPDVGRIEQSMADCHVDLGHADKAVPLLEHALAIREKTPRRTADDKVGYAMGSFGLARALWDVKPETAANRDRAKLLAKRAFTDLTALEDKRADGVVEWAKKRRVAL